jgi:protein ImuA
VTLPPAQNTLPTPAPEALHPALWRAWQMGRPPGVAQGAVPSGYEALDAQLPGGGWPARALTELLLPHAGLGELRLLAPALAALQAQGRGLMWFDPPGLPCAWALGSLGLSVKQLVVVRSRQLLQGPARARLPAADVLWALEHALKSGHLGAALAWLPARLPADALRRLQLAAQAHDGPVFLLRGEAERVRPSPAPLRLVLHSAGPDALRVQLLKRRGPPLDQPLWLELPPVLSPAARERALQWQAAQDAIILGS